MQNIKRYMLPFIIFLCIFTFLAPGELSAQDPLQVSGIIRDEDKKPLPYAHIISINRNEGTISDEKGMFSFIAYPNDTIRFTTMGYKPHKIVIPEDTDEVHYPVDISLQRDTVALEEVKIFPWQTYEEFKEVFLELDLPTDDYDRAMANIALIKLWIELDDSPDPAASYANVMRRHHQSHRYAGQLPSMNLLNPIAWGRFIQALRDGELSISR